MERSIGGTYGVGRAAVSPAVLVSFLGELEGSA